MIVQIVAVELLGLEVGIELLELVLEVTLDVELLEAK